MSISPHNIITSRTAVAPETYDLSSSKPSEREFAALSRERLLGVQAIRLLIRVDRDLREARAQFNQDWFRRLMCVRRSAVLRLRRRCEKISPLIPLGSLRRRYHAHLARYRND